MKQRLGILMLLFISSMLAAQVTGITKPSDYFGFDPGEDRKLFDYGQLISYLKQLDDRSDRISLQEAGHSPEGRPIYICFISSTDNIRDLEELKKINHLLALNPSMSEKELNDLVDKGKVFVLATLSMHSSEVGPSQSAPLIAYDFATTDDPDKLEWLEEMVYMMVPCHNPDGMDKVVNYYKKHVGGKYEGASLPDVYHKYVGHDNNRDFVSLTQTDSRAIARIYNLDWLPQVMVEKHQMGCSGRDLPLVGGFRPAYGN